MKNLILFCFLFISGLTLSAQNFYLHIDGKTSKDKNTIDSVSYTYKHINAKSVSDEINKVSRKLSQIGYIENQSTEISKKNDSTYTCSFFTGKQIKSIHIYIGNNFILQSLINQNEKDSLIIPYVEIENFLAESLKKAEQKGFALTKLHLRNIQKKNNVLIAELYFNSEKSRKVNEIVAKHLLENNNSALPKGHLKQLNSKFKKQTFNKSTIQKIYQDVEKFRFVNQIKYPEILLLQDTTKVYIYLEKRKSNNFDGYIGFNSNENNKVIFNGYLDLTLENTLKAGEQFSLYWKSDGNNQKTFRTNIEIPYIFNTNIGVKGQINIFKQDSIFQNTKTSFDLGYLINYNTRLYLGLKFTESSDIQNSNSNAIQDFKNSYLTTNLEYSNFNYETPLFPEKSKVILETGFGKRTNNSLTESTESIKQVYIDLKASYTFEFNKRNFFHINSQNFYLKSNSYLLNELYRFGGTASIRGFAENSLQAQYVSSILTEYRYIASPNLYLHSIFDFSLFKDPFSLDKKTEKLTGIGVGIGLQTKNGLLKISLANGIEQRQKSDFNNTIISLNYNIRF